MKINFLFLAAVALFLGACNNKPASTTDMSTTDTAQNVSASPKANAPNATGETVNDTAFLKTAYNVGIFEIRISKLAKRMTEHKKVKEFADMIIADHTMMDSGVVALLKQKDCAIPTELPADLEAKMKVLKEYMGKDFDQRYAQTNIDGHKEAIALFTKVSNNSTDAAVKQLAASALPILEKHETDADSLLVYINTPKKW